MHSFENRNKVIGAHRASLIGQTDRVTDIQYTCMQMKSIAKLDEEVYSKSKEGQRKVQVS